MDSLIENVCLGDDTLLCTGECEEHELDLEVESELLDQLQDPLSESYFHLITILLINKKKLFFDFMELENKLKLKFYKT